MNVVSCSGLIFLILAFQASGKDIPKTNDFGSLLDGIQNMDNTKITKAIEGFMKDNTEPLNMPPLSVAVTVDDVIVDGLKKTSVVFRREDSLPIYFEINLENLKHYGKYLIDLKFWNTLKIFEGFSKNVTLKKIVVKGSFLPIFVHDDGKLTLTALSLDINLGEVMFDIDGNRPLEKCLNKHFVDLVKKYGSQIVLPWVQWGINTFVQDDNFPRDAEGQVKKLNEFFKDAIEKMPEVIKINTLLRGHLEFENMQVKNPNYCNYQELKSKDTLVETRKIDCQQLTLLGDFNFVFNGGIVNDIEWVLTAVEKNNTHIVADQFEVLVTNVGSHIQDIRTKSDGITFNITGIINTKGTRIDEKVNNYLNTKWRQFFLVITDSGKNLLNFIIELFSDGIPDNKDDQEVPTSSGFANFVPLSRLVICFLTWFLRNV